MEKITKKRNGRGRLHKQPATWIECKPGIPSNRAPTSIHPPNRSEHTRTDCVGQGWTPSSVYRISTSPFPTGFTPTARFRILLLVFMVYGERERELDDNGVMPMAWKLPPQEG